MTREQIEQRIVKIRPQGSESATGLGIVSEERVFTCASHLGSIGIGAFQEAAFDVTLVTTGVTEPLMQYLATSYDFMVLAYNSLEVIDEGDGGYDVLMGLEDERELPPLPPARIEFTDDPPLPLKGYIFLPDGKTTHDVEISMMTGAPFVVAEIEEGVDLKGAGGGPLMTADHQLIGIVQGTFHGLVDENGRNYTQIKAVRLDLAMPEFMRHDMNWTALSVS